MLRLLWTLISFIIVTGCVSRVVPPELRPDVNRSITFEELVRDPDRYKGELLVLGGVILSSENRQDGSEIEVMQRPLTRTDRPKEVDETGGRFIALHPGYLETAVYGKERRVTVLGEVSGREERVIGELTYPYPVIEIRKIRLWTEIAETMNPYPPYWYDPFYYPGGWWYGPHSRYPYWP
jgi:outer membrane lipoprotein